MKEIKFIARWVALLFIVCTLGVVLYFASNKYEDHQIRISTNPWVGFTPFIYAQEKGWINESKFKFLWQVDLSENASLFERGLTHGFTATQYESIHIRNNEHLKPLLIIDQSFGADAIVSNFSVDAIKKYDDNIDVYLEMGSVNESMFLEFVKVNKLDIKKFNLINSDQQFISKYKWRYAPVILVTYSPYTPQLLHSGYQVISSTADLQTFQVIDGLFIDVRHYEKRKNDYKELSEIFIRSKRVFESNPEEFYSVIKNYLEGQTYEQFIQSTKEIQWANENNRNRMIEALRKQNIDTELIIK